VSLQQDFIAAKEEIAAKRLALQAKYKEAEEAPEDKRADIYDGIKSANLELADLVDKIEPLGEMVAKQEENARALKALRQPVDRVINDDTDAEEVSRSKSPSDVIMSAGIKSVGDLLDLERIEETLGRKSLKGFRGDLGELALKALITTADMTPLEERRAGIQLSAQEERTVADLMLAGTTGAQKVTYFEETTFTNAAAETDEAAAKPESALDFTLREDFVRKIATWIPVTDEMLEDVPGFESYLRGRLGFMVKQREELQLLRGAGTGVTIQGVYNRTGVQTVTGYGLSTIDSILKAITEIQTDAFVEPTALVIHPQDWFDVRTSKDLNGQYLLGPATQDPSTARPWGLQVRVTTNAIQNTALVGDFRQAQVYRKSGIAIAISTENEDYFIYNKLAVRAEERLALAVYRPAAFCKVEAVVQGS
jgi:HK97 family phage major capsid protein